jgi:hypothetical protein
MLQGERSPGILPPGPRGNARGLRARVMRARESHLGFTYRVQGSGFRVQGSTARMSRRPLDLVGASGMRKRWDGGAPWPRAW